MYELGSGDDLDGKLKFLQKSLMEMVQTVIDNSGKDALFRTDGRTRRSAPNDKARKASRKIEALSRSVLDYKPPKSSTRQRSKLYKQKLAPLAALEKRGGALLSVAEVSKSARRLI